jgi:ribosomal protein S18 acetylase RimI-like enzyme
MNGIEIRPATAIDLAALGRLGALLVAVHHEFDRGRFIAATPETADAYAAFLGAESGRADRVVLVARRAGLVLGYAYAGLEGNDYMALRGPAGALYDLVVGPEHRREGIGRALLEAAIGALFDRGAPRIVLSTADRNEAARRLFASVGFRATMIEMTLDLP